MRLILLALMLLALSACGAAAQPTPSPQTYTGTYFPVQKDFENRTSATALLIGELIEQDGCLRLRSPIEDTDVLILWPPGYSLSTQKDQIAILDPQGQVALHVGDQMYIDGGHLSPAANLDLLSEDLTEPLSDRCPGPYWLGGTEARREPGP